MNDGLIKEDSVGKLLYVQFQCHMLEQGRGCDLNRVASDTHWLSKSNCEENPVPRLSLFTWTCPHEY